MCRCTDQGRHRVHVEALVVGEEDTEAEREGHQQAEVGGQELEEVPGHRGEHLHVDAEGGQPANHQHQLPPHEEDPDGGGVVLPPGHQHREPPDHGQRVAVEADHDHVDDDAPLHPVLPVEEVEPLAVGQLEELLGAEHQGGHDEEDPDDHGGPGHPALLLVGDEAGAVDAGPALARLDQGEVGDGGAVPAVVLEDALAGVDEQHEGGVEHGEHQVEGQAHHEELTDLQPLEVQEALAERVLQQVVVARLDEGHEHRALAAVPRGDEHLVVQFELAVDVVDVALGEHNGLVQHVLELGQQAGDLPDDHGEGRGAAVGPAGDVASVGKEQARAVAGGEGGQW